MFGTKYMTLNRRRLGMVEAMTIAVIAVGAAFLFFGATFSSYGVTALGLLVGGSVGYFLAPTIAATAAIAGTPALVASILIGAVIGAVLSYVLLSMAVASLAFVIGSYVGMAVVAGAIVDGGTLVQAPVAIGFGLVCAVIAMVMTKTMMVLLTSFVGAALASRSVTVSDLSSAAETFHPEPLLFDVTALLFLGLFALGVLTQFGLFKLGYVTRLLAILPGVRPLRNRGRASE